MKISQLKLPLALLVLVATFLLRGEKAYANVIYTQADDSQTMGQFFPGDFNISYPHNGVVSVTIEVENSNNTANIFWDLQGGACTGNATVLNFGHVTTANVKEKLTVTGIDPSKIFDCLGASYFYSSSGTLTIYGFGGYPYVVMEGENSTRFLDPYTPANGAYASTTLTTFSVDYYFNCTTHFGIYDLIGIEIKDLSDPSLIPSTAPKVINACGQSNYIQHISLVNTHQYLWRPLFYSSTGTSSPLYGYWYSFLATSTPNFTPFTQFTGATVGTSTLLDTTNLLSFLNVPALLQTKVPFGYFFEAKDAIIAGINSTSTATIPLGTITFKIPGRATSTIDMFSTTTISYFLTPDKITLLRGIMLAVLYFELAYVLYKRGSSAKLI